jgi:hypothetical protein
MAGLARHPMATLGVGAASRRRLLPCPARKTWFQVYSVFCFACRRRIGPEARSCASRPSLQSISFSISFSIRPAPRERTRKRRSDITACENSLEDYNGACT